MKTSTGQSEEVTHKRDLDVRSSDSKSAEMIIIIVKNKNAGFFC